MPFNGSNIYSPPAADFPAVPNTVISSTHFNNIINDIASALSNCVTRDGQGPLTGNLNVGGFRITNIGAGSAPSPAVYFSTDISSGFYRPGTNQVGVSISGSAVANFTSAGLAITGAITGQSLSLTYDSAGINPLVMNDTNAAGANWIVGPGAGSGSRGDYNIYNSTAAQLVLRFNKTTGAATFLNTISAPTSVVTPLVGTTTANNLNFQANNTVWWSILQASGALVPGNDNGIDLGSASFRGRTGYFGTSVVTPLVNSTAGLSLNAATGNEIDLQVNGTNVVIVNVNGLFPLSGAGKQLGAAANIWSSVYAGAVDSGTTSSLFLRTNSGTNEVEVGHIASSVNPLFLQGAATGTNPLIGIHGSDTNVGLTVSSQGTGSLNLSTGMVVGSVNPITQFQVLHTASSSRWITATGSNGGNPVLSATAGQISIPVGIAPTFESSEQTVTASTDLSVAHSLGRIPQTWTVILRNKTTDLSYAVGDEVVIANGRGWNAYVNSTNIGIVNDGTLQLVNRTTHALATITTANWKIVFRAW